MFFFNDTATTEIYTLSLHDASSDLRYDGARAFGRSGRGCPRRGVARRGLREGGRAAGDGEDRKSTRLNFSHAYISYAVFCLKKNTIVVDYYMNLIPYFANLLRPLFV